MNKLTRNLILPAAALAALLLAPKSEARDYDRSRGHDARVHERYEHRRGYAPHVRGNRYAAPWRAPYRVASGIRFYSRYPGRGFVYVTGYGWVLPPFFGAVWVPGHYDFRGFWVEGFWR